MTRSFYDPKTLELELARVWKKCWLLACHESRLQDPGDFAALDVGPLSALVLRDAAGGVRAFANVCPHRGARLCDGTGSARSVTCPYHAFRFGLDGKLLGAPNVQEPPELSLVPLSASARFGFVWIAFSPDAEPIDHFLAPLAGELSARQLGDWGIESEVRVDVACNWKLSSEVHIEALHVPVLHSDISHAVDWQGAELTRLGRHARIDVRPRIDEVGHNVLLSVFPNVQLNLHPKQALVFRHRPHTTDPTRAWFDQIALSPKGSGAEPRTVAHEDPAIGAVTTADLRMAERLQRGLGTGLLPARTLTAAESPIAWFREALDEALAQR
ncbi:MAG: aromatic ring-hydroxylating dioxygenase subunit alpha [Myxococcales bacterium]|nr:aromatic ring-hydroxylating dioxygenase subunit alpha [Myxococcales bacterium]MCB9575858.1 aromatic ring-hydroxylating dioxygenase subunit alpha [Polyangiaceae bacterium]